MAVLLPAALVSSTNAAAIAGTISPLTPVPGVWLFEENCSNPGDGSATLRGVAVDSTGGVWMVGDYYPSGSLLAQVVVYNEPHAGGCTAYTPFTDQNGSHLFGVTAVSATDVWVVGDYGFTCQGVSTAPKGSCFGQPLALHFDGSKWAVVPAQLLYSETDFMSIGVDASHNVFAIGAQTDPVEGWNGVVEEYNPATQAFEDVGHNSVRGCDGSLHAGYSGLTFSTYNAANYVWVVGCGHVLRWDYSAADFEDMAVPLPPGNGNELDAIQADQYGQIRAVGGHQDANQGPWQPLFERYDLSGQQGGPGWVGSYVDTDPSHGGILYSLAQVPTDPNFPWITDAWAVGVAETAQHSIVYHNDGNYNNPPNPAWNYVPSLPNGGNVGILVGVAAKQAYSNPQGGFSESNVWAVGSYSDGGTLNNRELEYLPVQPGPAVPKYTTSRYVQVTVEPTMQALGCAQRAAGETGVIVLDYGAPRNWSAATPGATPTYGTQLPVGAPTVTLEKIQNLTVAFADGYAAPTCAPTTPVPGQNATIVIGTSNDIQDVTHVALNSGHGSAWGQLVNNVEATVTVEGYGRLASIAGGMDIEQNPSTNWGDPTAVTDWYNGYLGTTDKPIINFGSCDGCNPEAGLGTSWTPQDIYNLSSGISPQAQALPQNYYYGQASPIHGYRAPQAQQWRRISAYANPSHPALSFAGAMSEDFPTFSNRPKDSWLQLWQALNFDPTSRTASDLPYVTQITAQN